MLSAILSLQVVGRKVVDFRIFRIWCACHFQVGSCRDFPRPYVCYRQWRHGIGRKQHRSGNEVVMAKIHCHSLLSGSSWSSFEEDSPMEETEGICSYYASDLWPQLREKAPGKVFLGDLPCVVFSMIAMEVDENNGLDTVEATRLHSEGMKCDY